MRIYTQKNELKKALSPYQNEGKSIGFVPTMGALHDGHLSLISKSLQENDVTILSIFVNPTQFNNPDDLAKYPRTLEADVTKITKISKNVIIYAPEAEDIYGEEVVAEEFNFEGLDKVMEGEFRPCHFDGVGTIVKKLFEVVSPTKAYFGEKDYQQLLIIKKMVEQTQMPVQIIGCPIIRDENGLALSSRNERLSPEMKLRASLIYRTLSETKKRFESQSVTEVESWVKNAFNGVDKFDLEYFTIADSQTLLPVKEKKQGQKYRAFIVVFVDGVRLIDNIEFV